MSEIIIDPTLETVCLPLTDDEYKKLEEMIIRDGCQDALKVWDRDGKLVLLDGHNRRKICKANGLSFETSTIDIKSIDEAIIWICDNQSGRRNLATKQQQDYLSGKRYEAQKNVNRARDANGIFKADAPCQYNLDVDKWHVNRTCLKQANDEGVSHFKIQDNEKFAQGIDAIRGVSPKLADKILKPGKDELKLPKKIIAAIPKMQDANKYRPSKFVRAVKEIEAALETGNRAVLHEVVRDYIEPNEPTHEEKMIAKKFNVMPEHVRYANEYDIPYENLRTVDQIEAIDARKPSSCSTTWDGFYECFCGIKFEVFGSEHALVCCPHCGKTEDFKRTVR